MKEKPTVLKTVSFRYSILLSFSIFTILLHALVLQSYNFINDWLPLIKKAVQNQEEKGIHLKILLNAEEISVAFDETAMLFEVFTSYAELAFQGVLPLGRFYESFHEGQSVTVPAGTSDEKTIKYGDITTLSPGLEITAALSHSIWYHNNVSKYSDSTIPYELNSTHLDNLFRAAYGFYPVITTMYVGMDNGLLRVYPQDRLEANFLAPHRLESDDTYDCQVNSSDLTRYEHRCQDWYLRAIRNQQSVVFGRLHSTADRRDIDYTDGGGGGGGGAEGGGRVDNEGGGAKIDMVDVISLSKAMYDAKGEVVGVLAMDVKDTTVKDLLHQPILRHGYQFLVIYDQISIDNATRYVTYHQNCTDSKFSSRERGLCLLEDLEPGLFAQTAIVDAIYKGATGNATFYSDNNKYFVSFATIRSTATDYMGSMSIVVVVPYDDIESDYLTLKSRMTDFATYSLIVCVCIVVVVFLVSTQVSSFFFKKLINPLHEFNSQASEFSAQGLEEELGNVSTTCSFKYKKMAKVTSSFQSLIYILEDVNRSYLSNKFEIAYEQILLLEHIFHEMENEKGLGVILNNKGNILLKLFEIENHAKLAHECFKEAIQIGHKVVEDFTKLVDQKKKTEALFRFHTLTLAGRYCNMGNYYQLVRDYKAAVSVYEMSIGLYTQAGDVLGKARATGNIGHTYLALKSRGKAKKVFLESFGIAVEKFAKRPTTKARELLQNASMNMGIFYRLEERYEKARPYFVYALELSKYISKAVLFRCYSELVYIYHQSIDPRAHSMATLLKNDNTYFEAVTPRSIYFLLDTSNAMRKEYHNTATAASSDFYSEGVENSLSMRSVKSHHSRKEDLGFDVEVLDKAEEHEKYITRVDFAKDCIKFIMNSCLTGNDYVSLTTFSQKISRHFVHTSVQDNKEIILHGLDNFANEKDCAGPCALYDALQNTLLAAYGNTSFSNFDSWIVVFTSGKDSASTRTLDEMEAIMARINVNFIIVSLDTTKCEEAKHKMQDILARNESSSEVLKALGEYDKDEDDEDEDDDTEDNEEKENKEGDDNDYNDEEEGAVTESKVTCTHNNEDTLDKTAACATSASSNIKTREIAAEVEQKINEEKNEAEKLKQELLMTKRKNRFKKKISTFSSSSRFLALSEAALHHPLDVLFVPSNKRQCFHLNSQVASNDRIRFQLFSAFEEIQINVFDTFMESVI